MANDPAQARHFNEEEIGSILRRASELQGHGKEEGTIGLTLAELCRIAEEAGIDVRHVSAAIFELDMRSAEGPPNLWGGPFSLTLDRVVQGQVDEATWEAMLSEIRGTFSDVGHVVQRGSVWEWSRSKQAQGVQQAYVTATAEGGSTRLRIVWNEPIAAVPNYVLAGSLGLILIPIIFDSLGMVSFTGVALFLTLITMLYALARWTVMRKTRKKKGEVHKLMFRLEQVLSETEPSHAVARALENLGAPLPEEERLRLDISDPEQDGAQPARQAARRTQTSE
jgi:hypothetical protein